MKTDPSVRPDPFDLQSQASSQRDDLFLTEANSRAFDWVIRRSGWPDCRLVLTGPPGSGKSHLVAVWAEKEGARILKTGELGACDLAEFGDWSRVAIDDTDHVAGDAPAERTLFHLCNLIARNQGRLLMASRAFPSRWGIRLRDLASRLEGSHVESIAAPDDRLLSALLVKQFADRQIAVPANVVRFIVERMERSYSAAAWIVGDLDRRSLGSGRRASRALAAEPHLSSMPTF